MEWAREFFFPDAVDKEFTDKAIASSSSQIPQETGWDRIRRIFQKNEFEEISPEANMIMQAGAMSLFVGGIYGGFHSSKGTYLNFVKYNDATVYKDHLDAKKKLQDAVTKSFSKGAFRWGWRLSLFTTSYVGISTFISVYRGKGGIVEHVAAGSLTGFLYKFSGGPQAMVVGGGLGMVLGTLAGCCSYGLMSLAGMSMNDVRYWNYQWRSSRLQHQKEAEGKESEQIPHIKQRAEIYDENEVSLDTIPAEDSSK